jgi:hypothetical protein
MAEDPATYRSNSGTTAKAATRESVKTADEDITRLLEKAKLSDLKGPIRDLLHDFDTYDTERQGSTNS